MPEEPLSFGSMSTPGVAASALWTEVLNAVLPWIPTASRTINEVSIDFSKLLFAVAVLLAVLFFGIRNVLLPKVNNSSSTLAIV